MKVLGIYGSPRKKGNSDRLLDEVLEGARAGGAEVSSIYCRNLEISGCLECGGCDETGKCVLKDDMQQVYPLLEKADIIFLASPIFFYGLTAQAKALVDRCQAMWNRRMLAKKGDERLRHDSGAGLLVALGATKGKNLFLGVELCVKYFFDALDMDYKGGLLVRGVEHKGSVEENPELLERAFALGERAATGKDPVILDG